MSPSSKRSFTAKQRVDFAAQALLSLEELEQGLAALEKTPPEAPLGQDEFARLPGILHALKGKALMLGLRGPATLCHQLEKTLQTCLENNMRGAAVWDALFTGFDLLRLLLEEAGQNVDTASDTAPEKDDPRLVETLLMLEAILNPQAQGEIASTSAVEAFQQEAAAHLDDVEACLIQLGKHPEDREALAEIFRNVHSLKGEAAYVGLAALTDLTHAFESVLERIRSAPSAPLTDERLDSFYETLDALRAMVSEPNAVEHSKWATALTQRLNIANDGPDMMEKRDSQAPVSIFIEAATQHLKSVQDCLRKARKAERFSDDDFNLFFRAAHSLKGGARYMGIKEIESAAIFFEESLGAIKSGRVEFSPILLEEMQDRQILAKESLEKLRPSFDAGETFPPDFPDVARIAPDSARQVQPAPSFRVSKQIMDDFMNQVGELTVAKNALLHVQKTLAQESENALPGLRDLLVTVNSVARIAQSLQNSVMVMRLVPIGTIFNRFPRMMRDIARRYRKRIELSVRGEDVEIDKTVAEQISDPLVHILRNALDHGIEFPEDRIASGKPESGVISLSAFHEGDSVVVEVSDDGAGIDIDLLKRKALEKDVTISEELESLSQDECLRLIFHPGLSTSEIVTDISGRGVGMDVVLTNIRRLKGNVRVSSQTGKGTRIQLELPQTFAVIQALLVKAADKLFAIPVEAIRETLLVEKSRIKRMLRLQAIVVRGEILMVRALASILGLRMQPRPDVEQDERSPVLILEVGGKRVGIAVDTLLRREDLVVKPLVDYLAGIPGVGGASILGDGRALIILDPAELSAMALAGAGRLDTNAAGPREASRPQTIRGDQL